MAGPLAGLKVVDFSYVFAGPGTAMYLADQGADVVKVEPPDGAPTLGAKSVRGRPVQPDGAPAGDFVVLNRGKRSLPIDVKAPDGIKIVHALIKRSDIMIVAWPPGQAERLGLDYEQVRRLNPRLVYASITGWGPRGAHKSKLGYDYLVQAFSGIMASQPAPDGTPVGAGIMPADMCIPMYLAYAIMVALWERQSSGRGQMIETNQLQAQVAMQVIHLVRAGTRSLGVATNSPGVWKRPAHTYRAADGKYLVFMPLATTWPALWDALELGPFPDDPRLSSMVWPPELVTEIGTKIAQSISRRGRDEWLQIMESKQLGFMFSPVLDRGELMQQQQLADNEMLFEQPHPTVGPITMMTPPFRFSRTKWRKPKLAPELGQHTAQVLRELGYSPKQIADLRKRRVVA